LGAWCWEASSPANAFEGREGAAFVFSDIDGSGGYWTYAERILPADVEPWLRQKRLGAGRDVRLLGATAATGRKLLYREAVDASLESAPKPTLTVGSVNNAMPPCDTRLFGGSSVLAELNSTILETGVEPIQFHQHWLTHSGVNSNSSVAIEVGWHLHSLFYLYTTDGLNGANLREQSTSRGE
jgi:hypothetical protein